MRFISLTAGLLAIAALSLTLAACGGGSSSTSTQSASDRREAAQLKFTTCMRRQGVDLPDPGSGGSAGPPANIDQSKLQAASQACSASLRGAVGNISSADRQKFTDSLTRFTACLRGKGLNVSDPDPSGAGGPGSFLQGIDPTDPTTRAAMTACQKQVGLQLPGGAGGGSQ